MIKAIIRESIIFILLLLTIGLLLVVFFYDQMPTNKMVPDKVNAYVLPKEVAEEIKNTITGEENIIRTYKIDSSDLEYYKGTGKLEDGKVNPFAPYAAPAPNPSDNTSTPGNNTNTNSSNNNTSGGNSNETFYNETK